MEELPSGRLLINLQGSLLEAEALEGLSVGAELFARVEQLQPQIVLRILDPGQGIEAEAARILRANLPHQVLVGDSLNALRQELTRLAGLPTQAAPPPSLTKLQTLLKNLLLDDTSPTAEHLATFVRDGGLHYEAKLLRLAEEHPQALAHAAEGDVKGLLLQALKDAETASINPEARTAIVTHLGHIETQQAVNLLAQTHGEPYQLQIPFFSGQEISTAFLSIEADGDNQGEKGKRGKGEKGQGYNVLFLLDLEGFGQTRIDAHITAKTLWVAFYVDQSRTVSLLHSELPAFRETLQSLGYKEVLLTAKPLAQLSSEKRQKFDALAAGIPGKINLLDVRA
ncbi:MAG: hypothetical protein HYZ72_06065 [Deltaproteobacteria bacterium]|nr:hypothetical protein [Deltaproteobacteria bacterium]